jgi:hypothetical protein
MLGKFELALIHTDKNKLKIPIWLGNKKFHDSMKSALLYKNYEWYKQFNWKVKAEIKYVWKIL